MFSAFPPFRLVATLAATIAFAPAENLSAQSPATPSQADARPKHQATHFRKPIDAALAGDGRYLAVANRRSGTISLVDTAGRNVVGEFPASDRLSAMAAVGDGRRFAAVNDKRNELVLLRLVESEGTPRIEVAARTAVADDPAGVALSADGRLAAVAGRWSHRVQLVDIASDGDEVDAAPRGPRLAWPEVRPHIIADLRLTFAPREVMFLDDQRRLLVADAFGGDLAIVELENNNRIIPFRLDGQAIRGLAYDVEQREIVFAYQHLDQELPTTPEAIGQGRLLANRLRRTRLGELEADGRGEIGEASGPMRPWLGIDLPLDEPGAAAADPQNVVLARDGAVYLALGGSNQLAVVQRGAALPARAVVSRREPVGSRPTAVVLDAAGQRAFVVNQLSDSISLVDLTFTGNVTISLGPSPQPYPRDRGERLFFDARLSPGGFVSCHSCHVDGHSSGGMADTLGDGTYGTPKRILTLQGTSLTDLWAWNGEIRELREQVRRSLESTMHVPPIRAADHDDIAAFLHTLPFPKPAQPKPALPKPVDTSEAGDAADLARVDWERWQRGEAIFVERRCGRCHVGPLTYTSQPSFDVGANDERGRTNFNPPSLRGVSQNPRLFHDNRCATLESVFTDEQHQLDTPLSEVEVVALVRFLRSL
jgi:DNA-binding beta-propeller fold protein YncE